MISKLSIQDINFKGKKVLMRVDFNVPFDTDGNIADHSRIQAALTSIQYALNQEASLILMSHLGRPEGKKDIKFSLEPIAKALSTLLRTSVKFAPDCVGDEVEKMVEELRPKEVLLLENLRFHKAEEHPEIDPSFAKKLSKFGDIFVNDAFATAHRKHSSTYEITKYFPSHSSAGFLMEKEIAFLGNFVEHPKRPFFAIIGGAKVSSKVGFIKNLIEKVDALFIGGGMAFTFLKANGLSIGCSICEDTHLETAKDIIKYCQEKAVPLWLPSDIVIADNFNNNANTTIINVKDGIPQTWQGMDIGPKTIEDWKIALGNANSIFWNGPVGVFEMSHFEAGTNSIAMALASSNATTIIGGGDSVSAINQMNLSDHFTHLSTGGGASLEYIEFGHLPAIDVLSDR